LSPSVRAINMISLVDNDVILKMGKWDLLSELVALLGGDMSTIFHLATCRHVLCPPHKPAKALKRCGDQATVERIANFCADTMPLPPPKETTWLKKLNEVPDIDTGEVLLFAVGLEEESSFTYIGDKRSLVALAGNESLLGCVRALNGRIKCLEQIIAELIASHTLDHILRKIRTRKDVDRAMNMVLGNRPQSKNTNDIWQGLLSYYNHLNELTGGLLAEFPCMPSILNEPHMVL